MDDTKDIDDRCVLCLDSKRSPVSIKCGHSFCFGCLDVYKSYNKYPWAKKCPICRVVMEKPRKSLKRRPTDLNSNAQITPIDSVITNQSISSGSLSYVEMQRNNSLERFMSLAANYFDDGSDENDVYFDNYENMDEQDENSLPAYSPGSFSTDSEDYNDNFDDNGDYDDDHDDDDDDDDNGDFDDEPSGGDYYWQNNEFDDSAVTSYVNVDVDDDYDAGIIDTDPVDIDWETVIASDVIIID